MRPVGPLVVVTFAAALAVAAEAPARASVPAASVVARLAVEHDGRIVVGGRAIARGAQPAWSPDGRRVAFRRDGAVLVVDADGRHQRRVTPVRPGAHRPASVPAWSPDGTRIVFAGARDLFSVTLADGRLRRLTRSAKPWLLNVTPTWSPDGRTIAFSRTTDAYNSDIFLMRADGTGVRRLTRTQGTHETLGEETMPTWSADGRTVVFVSNRDGNFELYAIGADGRRERRLTRTPALDETHPRLSRDGTRLVYVRGGRVVTARPDGGGARVVARGTVADLR